MSRSGAAGKPGDNPSLHRDYQGCNQRLYGHHYARRLPAASQGQELERWRYSLAGEQTCICVVSNALPLTPFDSTPTPMLHGSRLSAPRPDVSVELDLFSWMPCNMLDILRVAHEYAHAFEFCIWLH